MVGSRDVCVRDVCSSSGRVGERREQVQVSGKQRVGGRALRAGGGSSAPARDQVQMSTISIQFVQGKRLISRSAERVREASEAELSAAAGFQRGGGGGCRGGNRDAKA
eukprot:688365-Rhodomonas_salina.1